MAISILAVCSGYGAAMCTVWAYRGFKRLRVEARVSRAIRSALFA